MSHEPDLRASDADREAAVERLRTAALDGRLDSDELEERLAEAYAASWCSELARLTSDVTPPIVFVRPNRQVNPLAIGSLVAAVFWFGFVNPFNPCLPHIKSRTCKRLVPTDTPWAPFNPEDEYYLIRN